MKKTKKKMKLLDIHRVKLSTTKIIAVSILAEKTVPQIEEIMESVDLVSFKCLDVATFRSVCTLFSKLKSTEPTNVFFILNQNFRSLIFP